MVLVNFLRKIYYCIYDPGYRAKNIHKISHYFWEHNFQRIAWIFASINHFFSHVGIDPGAKIHHSVELIHSNMFIGGTAQIGPKCRIMQNVTIGAKSKDIGKNKRTQAILEHNVTVCAGAVILGAITIGHNSVIGPNSVVTRSIPPYSLAVGNPAKIRKLHTKEPTPE